LDDLKKMDPALGRELQTQIDSYVARCGDTIRKYRQLRDARMPFSDPESPAVLSAYSRNCTSHLSKSSAWWRPVVESSLGVLYDIDIGIYYGTALLVDPDLILTARHNLFSPQQGRSRQTVQNILFYRASDPTRPHRAASFLDPPTGSGGSPWDPSAPQQTLDYTLVRLREPVAHAQPTVAEQPPALATLPLLVLGFHHWLAYAGPRAERMVPTPGRIPGEDPGVSSSPAWVDFVTYDNLGTCRVFSTTSNGSCVIHGCQTDSGMSGAPLFHREDARPGLSVVGIHVGALAPDSDCRDSARYASTPNLGLSVTKALLNQITGARAFRQ
jgi:hypothetical protein